jgi:hypothetical protein
MAACERFRLVAFVAVAGLSIAALATLAWAMARTAHLVWLLLQGGWAQGGSLIVLLEQRVRGHVWVETLVGPAGTSKSVVVGTLARAWIDPTLRGAEVGRVFGLATSQIATDVLTGEGLTARKVARWLATQDRLAAGPGSGTRSRPATTRRGGCTRGTWSWSTTRR